MSLQNLQKAFQLIDENFSENEKHFYGPQSLDDIKQAEDFLKVKFPLTYKQFLERYGCGGVNSLEIYGLTKEEDFQNLDLLILDGSNTIKTTLKDHRDFGQPLHLLTLYELGEGTIYCLDLSQMKGDECPVVVWPIFGYGDGNNTKLEILAQDFGDFFLMMIEERIRWKREKEA